MSKIVAVNASALSLNGALTILEQFINNIDHHNQYYIFINEKVNLDIGNKTNINLIKTNINTPLKRIFWDFFGFKKYLKKIHIKPDTIISLQNTSVHYNRTVQQIIYLHQGVMLSPIRWSFFKKNERIFLFYKYIYPLFVFLFVNKNTYFVVQTKWMKNRLIEQFKIPNSKIKVIKPNIPHIDLNKIKDIELKHHFAIFYPASNQLFKNHIEIINALIYLKNNGFDINNIGIYLTIDKYSNTKLDELISENCLEPNIVFVGQISYQSVLEYYKACNLVAFPSKIESFGLPLIEAATLGKKILCADTDYAREVIGKYNQATFVNLDNPKAWGLALYNLTKINNNQNTNNIHYQSSWADFFEIINS